MEPSINQEQLKNVIKIALVEVLEERQDLLYQAIEDVAFARAIEEGESTELVEREEIFKLFEGKL
jgi:ribosomal protein L12E/L44/L45/RPP1/RPP2